MLRFLDFLDFLDSLDFLDILEFLEFLDFLDFLRFRRSCRFCRSTIPSALPLPISNPPLASTCRPSALAAPGWTTLASSLGDVTGKVMAGTAPTA